MQSTKRNLFERWRHGELASTPGTATAALTIIFILTLMCATLVVYSKGPAIEISHEARQCGETLIKQVSKNGLEHYLGRHPIVRYTLGTTDGKPSSYGASFINPVLKNDTLFFVGRNIHIDPKDNVRLETSYYITNDLSSYEFTMVSQRAKTGVQKSTLRYRHGKMYLLDARGHEERIPLEELTESDNVIPPMLLDFFSSIASVDPSSQEAAFLYIDFYHADPKSMPILILECLVKPLSQVPEAVVAKAPDGHGAEVNWSSEFIPVLMEQQHIYYDTKDQIVWQQEQNEDRVLESVDENRLTQEFPGSQRILEKWLETYLYDKMDLL